MLELAIPILIALLIIGGIFVAHWTEKKRREGIRAFAGQLGIEYREKMDDRDWPMFNQFALAGRGRDRKASNIMIADSGELRMVIFDYQYTTGSGKNRHTSRQTVVLAVSANLRLPNFELQPEGFFRKIASLFGFKDINFEDDSAFSNAFELRGVDEAAIREFFSADRRKRLLERKGTSLEANVDHFIFYVKRVRWNVEKIKELMEQAFELYAILRSPNSPV